MSQQPIEYRQIYARMFAVRVQNGKHFTDSASEALQEGRYTDALQDLTIARSFFPDNEKLEQLIQIVKSKRDKAQQAARPEPRPQPSAPPVAPPPSSLPPPAPPLVLAGALPPPNLSGPPAPAAAFPPSLPPPSPPERGPALSNSTMGNSSIFGVSPSGGAVAGAVSAARLPGGVSATARPRRAPALTPEERPIEPDAHKRPPARTSTQDGHPAARGSKQDP
jgi:hypothetical protein